MTYDSWHPYIFTLNDGGHVFLTGDGVQLFTCYVPKYQSDNNDCGCECPSGVNCGNFGLFASGKLNACVGYVWDLLNDRYNSTLAHFDLRGKVYHSQCSIS